MSVLILRVSECERLDYWLFNMSNRHIIRGGKNEF